MIETGWFAHPKTHHEEWFKIYRSKGVIEVWFGHRWIVVDW